ncbi:MAG: ABC transporter permease [Verrucomicrobiota bacterium]|nr:ABC transporter permease [Verrucomicrobiota bacterium]
MFTDLKFAFRMLMKSPGFTAVAILTLALGIGANTAIFSVVNAVLLKPLPFPQAEQLVAVGMSNNRSSGGDSKLFSLSYPDFFDFREQNRTFAFLACYRDRSYSVKNAAGAGSVRGVNCSADLMNVLAVPPARGRGFTRADEVAGGGPGGMKVILSDEFWRKEFNGDPAAIGRVLELDRRSYLIIGVMPRGFQFPIQNEPIAFYTTIAEDAANTDGSKPATEQRGNHRLHAIGRLKAGVSISQGEADLSAIAAVLEKKYPDSNTNFGVALQRLREEMVVDVRVALYILFGAVVCVLLIANANVANLLLARASVRGKEIALRAALGASRSRIIRQLLTESLILSAIGGAVGMLLAVWGTDALLKNVPENIPRISNIRVDGVVFAFTLLVSLATGVLFGLVPAWQASHTDLNASLKSGGRGGSGGGAKGRFRNGLIVAEVALALVLLICAGLLLQSFNRLEKVSPGMRTDHLLTAQVSLPGVAYPKNENVAHFFDQLLPRVRALPGVEAASVIVPLPMSGSNMTTSFDNAEHPLPEGQQPDAPVRIIGTDYFKTAGIPLQGGRVFDEHDQMNSAPVVIVNARFAQKFFPGENAVGKQIKPGFSADNGEEKMREIVASSAT